MSHNPQSRKWMLTINNPEATGLNHEVIIQILQNFQMIYFCLVDEIGEKGTYHTHVFVVFKSPVRFETIKRRFPTAHIDKCKGSALQNKEYLQKSGKWADTEKAETTVEGTFFEFGNLPTEREEKSPDLFGLLGEIEDGKSTAEIVRHSPNFAFRVKGIDELREVLTAEKFMQENRKIQVIYLFGDSGTGKTRGIYANHPAKEICRITDYGGQNGVRFDEYQGQDVLVFEEFHSQIPIASMLNYLDVYPLYLPARYRNRIACFSTIYITSNRPLDEQYLDVQQEQPETWRAFLRRIHKIVEFRKDKEPTEVFYEEK